MTQLFKRDGTPATPNRRNEKDQPCIVQPRTCGRCGGVGGADKWGPNGTNTGWTCWQCDGSGKNGTETIILYTAEENERLDAAARKRAATKQRKAEIKAEIERQRREREKAEIISINADLLDRIDAELAHGDHEIMSSVATRIREHAKMPTERQIEVVEKAIAQRSEERARRANVSHVGQIKERRDFTLTLLYTRSEVVDEFPVIYSHWSLFLDENGCKIACKSAPWTLGLERTYYEDKRDGFYYAKGQTIRVKATVVDHKTDKSGEPVTYINRPKKLETVNA